MMFYFCILHMDSPFLITNAHQYPCWLLDKFSGEDKLTLSDVKHVILPPAHYQNVGASILPSLYEKNAKFLIEWLI